jgi:hypothetical protein
MTQESEAYQIETWDATNNKTTRRTIQPLPQPTRLQHPAPIEKAELTEMIDSLRNEMGEQQSRFDHKDELDAERNQKRAALSSRIGELTLQLREAQGELDQLNREGSIRQQFIAFAQQAEGRITAIANGVYKYLLEKISQERHDSDYKSLPPLLSEDVRFRVDKLGTRFLTQPSFASLHRTPTEQITNARIEATLEKVYTATEKLEGALEK